MIPLELFLGAIVAAVIGWGAWALWGVITLTFDPPDDVVDEIEQEREFLEAVQRASQSDPLVEVRRNVWVRRSRL